MPLLLPSESSWPISAFSEERTDKKYLRRKQRWKERRYKYFLF
ncbi:hypothetical protein SD77_1496 [Bacillus badius]|uniref:Uncharacterized protein n=1 Tax=Bacillus badius TaxID=1455 RepID=A0ABR5ARZ6_BACBA|nr:hypothetical protein SD78_3154 [Bacillus badius]KIL77510.1 hypothetical protein SD77_1496 [Bacillus badius]